MIIDMCTCHVYGLRVIWFHRRKSLASCVYVHAKFNIIIRNSQCILMCQMVQQLYINSEYTVHAQMPKGTKAIQ